MNRTANVTASTSWLSVTSTTGAWSALVALGLLVSCVPPAEIRTQSAPLNHGANTDPDTDWARHVKAPHVTRSTIAVDRLIRELANYNIPTSGDYLPAEQIAAYAIQELRLGRDLDAALLLSIASYRYFQQGRMAFELGNAQAHAGIQTVRGLMRIQESRRQDFMDMVTSEAKFFFGRNFHDELVLVRDRLFGATQTRARGQAYLANLAGGGEPVENFRDQLREYELSLSNRPERLHHRQLAEAFHRRLLADRDNAIGALPAAIHLSITPIDAFRKSALAAPHWPFNGVLIKNMLPRMRTLRAYVKDQLRADKPESRSNAAILLGLAAEPADLDEIRAAADVESDPLVSASLLFALIWHGDESLVAKLVDLARTASGPTRHHALTLLHWLPNAIEDKLDESTLVALARTGEAESRHMALAIIRSVGERRALTSDTVAAVVALTGSEHESVADHANDALARLSQLTAEQCKDLYHRHPGARVGLLGRLGKVATAADLDFLDNAWRLAHKLRAQKPDEARVLTGAIVLGVALIPGAASTQMLERWFAVVPDGEAMTLALMLAARDDTALARVHRKTHSRAKRVMLKLAFATRDQAFALDRQAMSLDVASVAGLARAAGYMERRVVEVMLWRLASYRNDASYPIDALVRNLAIGSLIRLELSSEQTAPILTRADQSH